MAIGSGPLILFASLYFESQDPGLRMGDELNNGVEDEYGEVLLSLRTIFFYVQRKGWLGNDHDLRAEGF